MKLACLFFLFCCVALAACKKREEYLVKDSPVPLEIPYGSGSLSPYFYGKSISPYYQPYQASPLSSRYESPVYGSPIYNYLSQRFPYLFSKFMGSSSMQPELAFPYTPSSYLSQYPSQIPSQYMPEYSKQILSKYVSPYVSQISSPYVSPLSSQIPSPYVSPLSSQIPSPYVSQYLSQIPLQYLPQYLSQYPTQYPTPYPLPLPSEYPLGYPMESQIPYEYPSVYPLESQSGYPYTYPLYQSYKSPSVLKDMPLSYNSLPFYKTPIWKSWSQWKSRFWNPSASPSVDDQVAYPSLD
ncbi:hypothetical protein Trydic_g14883 [Trypoxylus dichotomus]